MKFSTIVFAVFSALIVRSGAFEDGESPCPTFEGVNDCTSCVSANCGYVSDEGDCVMDCASVQDSDCFSLNNTDGELEAICVMAAEAQNGTSGGEDMDMGEEDMDMTMNQTSSGAADATGGKAPSSAPGDASAPTAPTAAKPTSTGGGKAPTSAPKSSADSFMMTSLLVAGAGFVGSQAGVW